MGKLFKILVWGKNGVGKTSLIEQLASGRVDDKPYRETIEDTYCIQYENSSIEKDIVLRVYDVGGVKNSPNEEFINIRHLINLVDAIILVFDNRSNESLECCKMIKQVIEDKTTDRNKKEILPILVLCNEMLSDERRSATVAADGELWTSKDKCFVGNRVWFVNLRDRTRVIDAFTTLIKELYKPQTANKEATDRNLLPRIAISDTFDAVERAARLADLLLFSGRSSYDASYIDAVHPCTLENSSD